MGDTFHWIGPMGQFRNREAMSVWLSVCLSLCGIAKHPLLGVVETSGQRTYSQYWPVMTKVSPKKAWVFFFNGTLMSLLRHFHSTSKTTTTNNFGVVAFICIGQEIQCLLYAGLFFLQFGNCGQCLKGGGACLVKKITHTGDIESLDRCG